MSNKLKPYRANQTNPGAAADCWKVLKEAIIMIQRQDATQLSFEELYRNAYNMVLHKAGEVLYLGLTDVMSDHLKEVSTEIDRAIEGDFLPVLCAHWDKHKIALLMIRDILMYMDKHYVSLAKVAPVYEMGLRAFYQEVIGIDKTKTALTSALISLVALERRNEIIDRSLARNIVHMLQEVGIDSRSVYEDVFEKELLVTTGQYYRVASERLLVQNNAAEYLKKVEQWLNEETERVEHYMAPETMDRMHDVVQAELITRHMNRVITMENSGMVCMMEQNKLDELKLMHRLLRRVDQGLHAMCNCMSAHLRELGKALVTGEDTIKDPIKYVQCLLDLKEQYDQLLRRAFDSDNQFVNAVNAAFAIFINLNPKSPEFISLFIDEKLKKGFKGASEEEIEGILDKSIMLFRFIQDKDVFERYYKSHLAKRLLQQKSISEDTERNMIQKLRMECGNLFTSKLEGMFKDMALSRDAMDSFRSYLSTNETQLPIELTVQVLTTSYWPVNNEPAQITLPSAVSASCEVFSKHYLNSHNGRKLTWQLSLGSADVRGRFGSKSYLLGVTSYQMLVLLLFNDLSDPGTLSAEDIAEKTGLVDTNGKPSPALCRALQSLACGKYKVLNKTPKSKDINAKDTFAINESFTSKTMRVKIPMVAQKETDGERLDTRQKVDDDRKNVIEACIVRIMKARKIMDHANLVAEVTTQLQARFMPNPQLVKQRIENLIEKEYLERSKDNRKMYHYLA